MPSKRQNKPPERSETLFLLHSHGGGGSLDWKAFFSNKIFNCSQIIFARTKYSIRIFNFLTGSLYNGYPLHCIVEFRDHSIKPKWGPNYTGGLNYHGLPDTLNILKTLVLHEFKNSCLYLAIYLAQNRDPLYIHVGRCNV